MKKLSKLRALTLALLASVSAASYAVDVTPTSPRLSVQLWSVKDDIAKDFEGTLGKLAAMGFQGVEFFGYFGSYAKDPQGLRALLDRLGLQASSAHVGLDRLSADKIDATVAFYKAIACQYLIIPMDARASTVQGAEALARDLESIQRHLAPQGMRTGYHNHREEMLGEQGRTPWDVIGRQTSPAVILQQDVGWTEAAGKNPVDFIKAYPGRTVLTHYKAAAPQAGSTEHPTIGRDSTDWKALIMANRTIGGTLWLVLEQEVYPAGSTPLESVEASLRGLEKIISEMNP